MLPSLPPLPTPTSRNAVVGCALAPIVAIFVNSIPQHHRGDKRRSGIGHFDSTCSRKKQEEQLLTIFHLAISLINCRVFSARRGLLCLCKNGSVYSLPQGVWGALFNQLCLSKSKPATALTSWEPWASWVGWRGGQAVGREQGHITGAAPLGPRQRYRLGHPG